MRPLVPATLATLVQPVGALVVPDDARSALKTIMQSSFCMPEGADTEADDVPEPTEVFTYDIVIEPLH